MAAKDIGIALVGCGGSAGAWIEAYRRIPGVVWIGFYDSDPTWAERFADRVPDTLVFHTLEEILQNPEIYAVEINLPPEQSVEFAARCLEAQISVGIRSTAVSSLKDAELLLSTRKKKLPVRVFSPAFYYPPLDLVRRALDRTDLGDVQTMRIKSVIGKHGLKAPDYFTYSLSDIKDLCTPEYEALPLMYLLGEVRSVHAYRRRRSTLITWTSSIVTGAAKYGVYEAVQSQDMILRSDFDPVEETFELAGTDGYLFGAGLTGKTRDLPSVSVYRKNTFDIPLTQAVDDPVQSYFGAALDLIEASKKRQSPRFGVDWIRELSLLREGIRASIEAQNEILLENL